MTQHMQNKLWRKLGPKIERWMFILACIFLLHSYSKTIFDLCNFLMIICQAEKEAFEEAEKIRRAKEEEVIHKLQTFFPVEPL